MGATHYLFSVDVLNPQHGASRREFFLFPVKGRGRCFE